MLDPSSSDPSLEFTHPESDRERDSEREGDIKRRSGSERVIELEREEVGG